MSQRDRVSAAAWLVVRDAHTAEDIFQNVALKAMTKGTQFESGGALMSWAFITARREGIDWLRRKKNAPVCLDNTILELLEQEWQKDQKPQQQQDQEPPLVDKLAELKMLRALQLRINRRTRRLARLIDGDQATAKDVLQQLRDLARRQARVQRAARDLATGRNR